MDERFKIVFEASTEKFKQQVNGLKSDIASVGEQTKINLGIDVDEFEKDLTKAQKDILASIKQVQENIEWQKNRIEEFIQAGLPAMAHQEMLALDERELASFIEKFKELPETIKMSQTQTKELISSVKQLEATQSGFFSNFAKNMKTSFSGGINNGIKKIKRFTLALFGIHSIYRMLSRASSAYLAQDSETAQKLQSAWIGLGSIFAPILQKVADFVIKAVKYLDIFWTAFTGKGFLTNTMEKTAKKATGAVKALNKQLAGFDEITNIGDTGGGGLATPDWTEAFKGIEVNAELANKITELGEAFRDLWSKYIEPFKNDWGKLWDILGKPLATFVLSSGLLFDLLLGNWIGAIVKFGLLIVIHWKDIWDTLKSILKTSLSIIGGILTTIVQLFLAPFTALWKSLTDIFNNIKKIFTGIIDFIAGVFTGNWQRAWQGIINIFSGIFGGLWAIVKYPINLIIEGLNAFIRGLNKIKFDIPSWVPLIGGKAFGININPIPPLATGTNYVPSDMIANIHKGEAVIPKKFNKAEFFGGGNEETNSLLAKLIEKVEQIEINPYTEIKDVGKATTRYTKNRRRILGTEGV